MVSTFHTLQDFYLTLLLEQVLEQKHLCGWSTSGVLLERVLWLGSAEGIQVQLSSVHQSRVWRSHLGKLLQNPAPPSICNTQICVPQVVLVLLFLRQN